MLSACCLFLLLAKANTWLNPIDNTVLAFGYRFFILFVPYFIIISRHKIAFFSFLVAIAGIIFWFFSKNLLGAVLFSAGIAVSGYVLKVYVSKTAMGAANNKIALNAGVVFSGILVYLLTGNNHSFLIVALFLIVVSLACSFFFKDEAHHKNTNANPHFSFKNFKTLRGLAWGLVGLGTGIKFMSKVSILPQYLLSYHNTLPAWYGFALSINAVFIILFQRPIMRFVKNWNLKIALIPLILSMLVIAVPQLFFCETVVGAFLWVILLTLFECAVSVLDTFAYHDHSLLVKEGCVGVGCAAAVLVMRLIHGAYAATIIGGFGTFILLLAFWLLMQKTKEGYK